MNTNQEIDIFEELRIDHAKAAQLSTQSDFLYQLFKVIVEFGRIYFFAIGFFFRL